MDEAAGVASPSGLWSTSVTYTQPITCAVGGTVVFRWTQPTHDVVLMASEAAYNTCDFTNSTALAPASGTGEVLHRNPEWVKHMDERGHIVNHDWGPVYAALRKALNGSTLSADAAAAAVPI